MNLSSLNVSSLNARDLQIILNGSFGMRNTQLPARKGDFEITTSSFNISTSSDLPIAFKITNTERMKLTPTELSLDCNLSQGQNYSANISNLTSNVMFVNQIHASSIENTSSIKANVAVIQNSNNDKLYIDGLFAGTSYFDINSTGIPIHFNVNTNPFNSINNMEMTSAKTLMFKDLEMGNTVSANISTLNASTISVSTFNITQTSFTNLNASTANMSLLNISSLTFVALDITRETNSAGGGCMIQLEKSHITGHSPETPWRFGPSGLTTINNHFIIEPNNVTHGNCFNLDNNGVLKLSGTNAANNFENSPVSLILRNATSTGYVGGHFGKYLRFSGNFTDGGSYNTYFMPRRGGSNSYNGMVLYSGVGGSFHFSVNQGHLEGYTFYVNGSAGGNSWTSASDDRIKYNEEDIKGLEIIRKLKPKKYDKIIQFGEEYDDSSYNTWTPPSDASFNENPNNYEHIQEAGIIAQDLLQTDISFVVTDKENPECAFTAKTVDYNSIFIYAIQAIKELDEKQTKQNEKINNLETKVNDLEAENDILKGLIQ